MMRMLPKEKKKHQLNNSNVEMKTNQSKIQLLPQNAISVKKYTTQNLNVPVTSALRAKRKSNILLYH